MTQSRRRAHVPEDALSIVGVEVRALAGELGDEQVFIAVVVEVAGVHPHAGFGLALVGQRGAGHQGVVTKGAVALVDPQQVLLAIVGDENIHPPVAVVVGGGDAQRRPECAADQRRRADIDESAPALIAVQAVRLATVDLRRTVVAGARHVRATRLVRQRVVRVVAHIEVKPAVTVVVQERGRHGEASRRVVKAACLRLIGKGPVAVVAPQLIDAEIGQEQIDPAVVVDISRGHAQAELIGDDAARVGDVGEAQLARALVNSKVVSVQAALECPRLGRPERPPLNEVDVQIAVVVVVEQPDARRQNFGIVEASRGTVDVHEVDARRLRDIGEPRVFGLARVGARAWGRWTRRTTAAGHEPHRQWRPHQPAGCPGCHERRHEPHQLVSRRLAASMRSTFHSYDMRAGWSVGCGGNW